MSSPRWRRPTSTTVGAWRGFNGSLRYRHISADILDGTHSANPLKRASGLDVVDLSVAKEIRHGVELSFGVDNLNNKSYYETQNYFVSRVHPTDAATARVHATPGSPIGFTAGVTFRLGEK